MRRTIFLSLGVLEFLIALVLLGFAWQLPGPALVQDTLGRVERVGEQTVVQISQLQRQLKGLKDSRPRIRKLAGELRKQMRVMLATLPSATIDLKAVRSLSESLGEVAKGLDGLAESFKPELIGQLGGGLKTVADYLDKQLVPAATEAADRLDRSTALLKADAERLAALAKTAPLDLKAVKQLHDGLSQLVDGLGRVAPAERLKHVLALRDGLKGMETALSTGADQVEKMAGYTYPQVTLEGFKPKVENKSLWPEGGKIAEGLRQAAKGAGSAAREMAAFSDDLPKFQKAIEESRKVAVATRDALGAALKDQEKVEPLLKDVPLHAARLADELPRLGGGLAKVLRDTSKLKEVAASLRKADEGFESAAKVWPELRIVLSRSAKVLRDAQARLQPALENPQDYDKTIADTRLMAKAFSEALPLLTDQLQDDLSEQETSLGHLNDSVKNVTASLPDLTSTASGILQTARVLLALVALVFALHGAYVILTHFEKDELRAKTQGSQSET